MASRHDEDFCAEYAAVMQSAVAEEVEQTCYSVLVFEEALEFAARVVSPTLLLFHRDWPFFSIEAVGRLAAALPSSELFFLENDSYIPYSGDNTKTLEAVRAFLDDPRESSRDDNGESTK